MAKERSVSEKMGIKEGLRGILIHATAEIVEALKLPAIDRASKLQGTFDYIHFFAGNAKSLESKFPTMKKHLRQNGMLWISWPKGGRNETDLNIKIVIRIGYDFGLVESKTLSVNETWSAIKFTFPKAGKE